MDVEEVFQVGRKRLMQALKSPSTEKPKPSSYVTSCEIGGEPLEPEVAYVGYCTCELTHAEDTHPVLSTRYLADCAAFVVFDPVNNVGAFAHCPGKTGYPAYERDAERLVSEIARGFKWSDETRIGIYGTNCPMSVADVIEKKARHYFEGVDLEKKVGEAERRVSGPIFGIRELILDTRNGRVRRTYGSGEDFHSDFST